MLRLDTICALILAAVAAAACDDAPSAPDNSAEFVYRFHDGPQGWTPLFVGWNVDDPLAQERHRMVSGHLPLAPPLASLGSALFIQGGGNWSWVMLYKRQATGLTPGRSYRASFFSEIATDVPSVGSCFGIGGPAGTTVHVKAGASALEPDVSPNQFGTTELNIDLGGAQDGPAALTLGTVGNTHTCSPFVQIYQLKQFNREGLTVQSDAAGRLWLVMAIRFWGFEGFMGTYFTQFRATLEPM